MMDVIFALSLYKIPVSDVNFILIIIFFLFSSIMILKWLKTKEDKMEQQINKAKKDMLDLEAITKNIDENYKPLNIELTSYEQEQEKNAIISYQELLSSKNSKRLNYEDDLKDSDISVRRVEVQSNEENHYIREPKIEVTLMSYEKEEAFLKALKQLQSDLAR